MTVAKFNLARVLHEWETGKALLTPERRLDQLFRAHRLRNFIFSVGVGNFDGTLGGTARFQGIGRGKTPPFADDLILTDLYWNNQVYLDFIPQFGGRVTVIGAPGVYAEDLFGVGQFIPLSYLGHCSSDVLGSTNINLIEPSLAMDFVPRLLKAGEYLQIDAAVDQFNTAINPLDQSIDIIAVFNSVKALCPDDPYACPSPGILKMCQEYVKVQPREQFILDLRIEHANFPTLRNERTYRTEAQARPLLIWGMASNISGAQVQIRDDAKQYSLLAHYPQVPFIFIEGDGSLFNDPTAFNDTYPPLWSIAPDQQASVGSVYKWLPVPHFLEPNSQLVVTLKNGLNWYNQPMTIAGNVTAPGHISFMCTTL